MSCDSQLHEKIINRYEGESAGACILSCGNTLDELAIEPGEMILDLGCGRGADTIRAAELSGKSGTVIGLDLTQAMIDQAIENAVDEGVENVVFIRGDIEDLPFADGIFDGVMSNCVINHARDKKKAYSEIQRILRPGGRFAVADAVTKEPLPLDVKNDPEAWAQCFGGAVTEEEYLESILAAGFKKVEILNRREYVKNGYDFISLTIKAVK